MKQVVAVCLLLIIAAQASYVRTLVGLKQDVAAAEAMLMEISDPRSPSYAHYLTPEQVGDLIGASPQDIESVITFLESRGARAINVLPTKDWIRAELPVSLATQMQNSIPEQIRTKVDFIQVLNSEKKLEMNEEFNYLAVALPESAPLVFLHRTVLGDSVDLWVVPSSRVSEIQEIQVRLESFDKRFNIPALELSLSPEGASMQCMPCEQLTMKPRIPSEPNFCSQFVENHLVCFARDLQFEIPEDLPENFLWKLASRIRTSGHWSDLGWFSGLSFAGTQRAIPFKLADEVWDPNSQKAQYQQSTTLVGTSGAASQIVWGTGSYGYSTSDLSKFYSKYNIPTSTSYVSAAGDAGDPSGDNYVEAELDIQYVSAFGPQIASECVNTDNATNAEGSTGFGSAFLDFTTYINTLSNPPLVISLSLGSLSWDSCNILCSQAAALGASTYDYCLNYVQSQFQVCMYSSADQVNRINTELMKMGMIGVSVFGAAGDGGNHFSFGAFKPVGRDANLAKTLNQISCNYTLPTFPAASPWVTAVGATQMQTDASGYYPVGCSTQTGGGITGGCGFSWMFAMPSYQQTAVESYLNAFAGTNFGNFNASGRAYPDISGIGSAIPIVFNGITTMVDGTSCSTPTVAGMFSLINDNRLNNGLAPLGFINTRLYQAAATQASSMFVDVTEGSSECGIGICCDTGFDAAAGWDAFTGWGNPLFPGLLAAFAT